MNRARWAVIVVFLILLGAEGGLVYYFRQVLPPWSWGFIVGLPLFGAVVLFLLVGKEGPESPPEEIKEETSVKEEPEAPPPERPPTEDISLEPQAYVATLIGILQREGRLLDFLNENLDAYDDAQIGAAVRTIHRGLRRALFDLIDLAPVVEAKEGVEIVVEEGFDPKEIRLVGNVKGRPPFKGILRHRGWRLVRLKMPRPKKDHILAPAEVEIP